jgi:hypothetical protein
MAVVLAFSALGVVSVASGAETLWRWLPGTSKEKAKETFKGEVSAGTLTIAGGNKITCTKGKILLAGSELVEKGTTEGKDATLALATIHFEGCKAEGLFAANSLGDEKEIILAHIEIHNCMINKANKEFGLLILPLETHIEIPALALLIIILEKGLFIAKIVQEGAAGAKITAEVKEGKQNPEKCEGGEKEQLLAKIDAKVEETATINFTAKIEFCKQFDAEEKIME